MFCASYPPHSVSRSDEYQGQHHSELDQRLAFPYPLSMLHACHLYSPCSGAIEKLLEIDALAVIRMQKANTNTIGSDTGQFCP